MRYYNNIYKIKIMEYNLNPTEMQIFNYLKHIKATSPEIGRLCKIKTDDVLPILDSLNQRGFVNKETNEFSDRWYVSEHWLN